MKGPKNMNQAESPSLVIGNQEVWLHSSQTMSEIADGTAQLIVTSPPYWNLKDYHTEGVGKGTYEQYLEELQVVWDECFRASTSNAVLVVNVNSRRVKGVFHPIAMDIYARMRGWKLLQQLIWYIPNALPQPAGYINRLHDHKFEDVLVFSKDNNYVFNKPRGTQTVATKDPRAHKKNPMGRSLGDVLRIPAYRPPTIKKMNYHVAAFPEELVHFLIHTYSNPGDVVIDPFLGSGTTLKVARAMERRGVGYEINPDYGPLIQSRISEPWTPQPFELIDIIASSAPEPKTSPRRRHKQPENVIVNGLLSDDALNEPLG